MICEKCSRIPFQDPGRCWMFQHHSTYAELDKSARNGCEICVLFRRVLLEYYADHLSSSVEEAENFHRQLDQDAEEEEGRADKTPCSGREFSSNTQEEQQQDQEAGRYTFFVEFVDAEIDDEHIPLDKGLQRLTFIRRQHEEGAIPLGDVYPFVQISSLQGNHVHFSIETILNA
jgi:hypothetical protein